MPSADDFSLIKELMMAKIPPEESEKKEQLKQLLIDVIKIANEMRQQSTEFYGQITSLMQFVDNFEQQKNKYNEPSGEECINFHERLDALSGTKPKPAVLAVVVAAASVPKLPVGGGVVEEQPKVERTYTDDETRSLISLNGNNPMVSLKYKKFRNQNMNPAQILEALKAEFPDINIPAKYEGDSDTSAPAGGLLAGIVGRGSALNLGGSKPVVGVASLFAPKPPVAGGLIDGIGERGKKTGLDAPLDDHGTTDDDTPTDNGMPKQHRVEEQPKVERVYTDDEIETLGACKAAYKKQLGLGLSPDAIRAKIKSIMQLEIEPKYTGGSVVTVAASAPKLPVAGGFLAGIVGRGSALNLGGSKPVVGVASLFAPKPPVAGGLIDGIGERGKKTGLDAPLDDHGTTDDDTPTDNGMPKQHRVEEQLKVERVYEDSELGQLSNVMARGMYKRLRNEGNTAAAAIRAALTEKYPDLEIEPKYTGGSVVTVAASAPKLPVAGGLSALFGAKLAAAGGGMLAALGANQPKFIYAKLSPMRSLVTWLNKDDKKLKEEIAGELAKARSSNMSDTSVLINAFYEPLMQMQIAYLQQVDFSKLEKEEDAFYLVRQVLSTVDLYLRIKRHEKLFSGVALNVASKNERKKFEDECFSQKNYTIFHIIKAFKTPVSLNANQTNDLLVRIKTGHSDLKRLIGNTIIEAFEAGSINIIDPVITAIESY
jgi:hypothetical protein